jgi:hypothetical protein
MNLLSIEKSNIKNLDPDRTQTATGMPREQLIHQGSSGPKVWKVYSRRGKKGNGGYLVTSQ